MAAIAFLLFTGSRVFASLIAAINLMWHEIEATGFWRRQLQRTGMVFTVGALLVLAGAADVALALAGDALDLPPPLRVLIQSQLVPALFIGSGLFLLFYLIPRKAATWRTALAGAIFGAVALRLAQALFTGYLRDFGGFDSAYGPIAGLAAVLTWALVASGSSCSPRTSWRCSTRRMESRCPIRPSFPGKPRRAAVRSHIAATADGCLFVGDRRARLQSAPHR